MRAVISAGKKQLSGSRMQRDLKVGPRTAQPLRHLADAQR